MCTASKVGQGLGPQRLSANSTCRHCEAGGEIAKARFCVDWAIVHADGALVEKGCSSRDQAWQRSRIHSRRLALWVLITWAVTSPQAVQRLTRRCCCSSSGRIIRCGCQFQAEPVGACWWRGFRSLDELIGHAEVSCRKSASRWFVVILSEAFTCTSPPNFHCVLSAA